MAQSGPLMGGLSLSNKGGGFLSMGCLACLLHHSSMQRVAARMGWNTGQLARRNRCPVALHPSRQNGGLNQKDGAAGSGRWRVAIGAG